MKNAIQLGNKTFQTKKELKEFIQRFIKNGYLEDIIDESHEYFELLKDLIKYNPDKEKADAEIKFFSLGLNEYNQKYIVFNRQDDSSSAFGHMKCISNIK
jgi:hypothetical protein